MEKQCQRCGKEYEVRPANFKLSKWCPECRTIVHREKVRKYSLRWHREKRKTNPEYAREVTRRCYTNKKLKIWRELKALCGEASA